VLGSTCVFKSSSICLMKLGSPTLLFPLVVLLLLLVWSDLLFLFWLILFEVYFIWCKYCYSCLIWGAISLVNLLPPVFSKAILISVYKVDFL
jgi:hypothetical protein